MKEELLYFKPRARILLQLGEQLIKNESIALLEIVKNSYDADAQNVKVTFQNIDDQEKGKIIIEDDGTGMDADIIGNVWMEPGSDYKAKLFKGKIRSPKFNRLPLGEKGIGRFGVHKLGSEIKLISKQHNNNEVYFHIDWTKFEKAEYLGDVGIELFERKAEVFKHNQTGTKIIIKKLKTIWTRGMLRDVYRAINSLNSPFESLDSFKVSFKTDKQEWLKGLLSFDEIKDYALFEAEAHIKANVISKLEYAFSPWKTMTKLNSRKIIKENIKLIRYDKGIRKWVPFDYYNSRVGNIKLKLLIFDRGSKILSYGVQDKKGLTDYLDINGGIRVYRDGIRVYDYGEPENDWLELDIRRVNIPTVRISNNIVIGAVYLQREQSEHLIEKTNREGFIENQSYEYFKDAVLFAISKIETERSIDKEKLRTFYGPSSKSEPVLTNIAEMREKVEKNIKDEKLKKDLNIYLKRIEDDYKYINEILLRSAGVGLSLSIVIHEIEKIIKELNRVIKKEKPSSRIVLLAKHLAQLVEGYASIVKHRTKGFEDLKKIIRNSLFNIEFRLEAHNIKIEDGFSSYHKNVKFKCSRNLIIGSIVNIIDNSIWWLEYGDVKNKKIYIGLSDEINGFTSIVIADNGSGFSLPTEQIIKPFISDKPDGMGLGLHIASEIMKANSGELIFPENDDISIPQDFINSAITVLAFREDNK